MNKRLTILLSAFALIGFCSTVVMVATSAQAQTVDQPASVNEKPIKATHEEDDDDNTRLTASVSMGQAVAAATGRVAGFANQAVLEIDEGRLQWDVEIVTSSQKLFAIEVDASTGAVLTVDDETDGGDDDGDGDGK